MGVRSPFDRSGQCCFDDGCCEGPAANITLVTNPPTENAWSLVPNGVNQSARIVELLQSGDLRPKPGSDFFFDVPTSGTGIVASKIGGSSKVDWDGGSLAFRLDLSNPLTAYKNILLFSGVDLDWRNLTIRFAPALATEGVIAAVNLNDQVGGVPYATMDVTIQPQFWPTAWATSGMDTYGVIDPSTGGAIDWQYRTDDNHRSFPYFIVQTDPVNNPNNWRAQFPIKSANVLAVISKQPLTLQLDTLLSDGETITFDDSMIGLAIDGVSVLNNKTFRVRIGGDNEDDDGTTVAKVIDALVASPIVVPGATNYVSGGTAKSKPIRETVQVGRRVALLNRKRGGNPFILNGCVAPKLRIATEGSGAGFIVGKGNIDPTISLTGRGKNFISTNADSILLSDTKGKLLVEELRVRGSGDTFFATPGTVFLPKFLAGDGAAGVGYGPDWLEVKAWSNPLVKDNNPWLVEKGDEFVYQSPDAALNPLINPVLAVVGNRVYFTYPHPAGFVPGMWRTWNRTREPHVEIKYAELEGSFTVALTTQGRSFTCDRARISRCYGNAVRIAAPGANWNGRTTGSQGKVKFNNLEIVDCGFALSPFRKSAISIYVTGANGQGIAAPQIREIVDLGNLLIDGTGYGALGIDGRDVVVTSWRSRRTGLNRGDGAAPTDPQVQNDIYIRMGKLDIYTHFGPLPSFFEAEGGYVTFWQGSMLRTPEMLATAGQLTFDMFKKVQVGHEDRIQITVDGIPIPADKLTANGTKTVAIDAAWAALGIMAGAKIQGVHNKC